jgi:hypothetical protein
MATVVFSPEIQQHVSCPPLIVFGNGIKEILDAYFERNGRAREYILDEGGCLSRRPGPKDA